MVTSLLTEQGSILNSRWRGVKIKLYIFTVLLSKHPPGQPLPFGRTTMFRMRARLCGLAD